MPAATTAFSPRQDGTPIAVPFRPLDLAVVVPTFNEAENIRDIVGRLTKILGDVSFEIIVVDDDSPDGTGDLARQISMLDPRVRCLQRIGRRGLSSAVIEGMMATSAPVVAVMDGDLQHDETKLPEMLDLLRDEHVDLVVGSRYLASGSFGNWSHHRQRMSKAATWLARRLTGVKLTDPMSGFFVIRTDAIRRRVRRLAGVGYKILLDILSSGPESLELRELPYGFRSRQAGQSKLDNRVLLEFLELLIARTVGRWIPTKFAMFSIVGSFGVLVHMLVLSALFETGTTVFSTAQATATLVAMTVNFLLNNAFTYFDRRLRGWQLLTGWLSFSAVSAVGALANVGVAVYLFEQTETIWFLSALAGVTVGATWNYAMTALYTWRGKPA